MTFRSRFAMSRAGLAAVLGVALGVPSALTGQGERSDWPASRIDVGDHHLYVDCRGEGTPTVVFEAGMGASSLAWRHVQAALAGTTRACVYDRAGLGRSDPGPQPRDGRSIAAELHALLGATESGPYVMVGHSFGGYIARIYRDLYPQEIVGLALVESAHDEQWSRLPAVVRRLLDQSLPGLQAKADSARAGTLSAEGAAQHSFFSRQGEEVWREHRRQSADPDHLQAHVD